MSDPDRRVASPADDRSADDRDRSGDASASTAARIAGISVAIPTLNRPAALTRCLDTLLAGDVLPAEVIVVDQSEGDETAAVTGGRKATGVRIHYIRQACRGLSASRNQAIAVATCPILAFTDDDCVPDRGWLAAVDRAFSAPSPPDAVTGRVLPLGPETSELHAVSSRTDMTRGWFSGKIEPWRIGAGGNWAVTRSVLDIVGPFDERLGAGSPGAAAEDVDILYRVARAGGRVLYEPDALVFHERTSRARRLATRSTYGHGMGAFCALWIRRRDFFALCILYRWLRNHGWAMAKALSRGRWTPAHEELLMLAGTVRGFLHGLLASTPPGPPHGRARLLDPTR